jgi:hypothetical protein
VYPLLFANLDQLRQVIFCARHDCPVSHDGNPMREWLRIGSEGVYEDGDSSRKRRGKQSLYASLQYFKLMHKIAK